MIIEFDAAGFVDNAREVAELLLPNATAGSIGPHGVAEKGRPSLVGDYSIDVTIEVIEEAASPTLGFENSVKFLGKNDAFTGVAMGCIQY